MKEFKLPHDHGNSGSAQRLFRQISDPRKFEEVAMLFNQLSDTVRLRIFWILSHREECVINISAMLGMSSPAISHHLRQMKEAGILESGREGKEVYYRVADNEKTHMLHEVIENIAEIDCPLENGEMSVEEIVKTAHDHLLANLHRRITIEELSILFHINSTTLKQEFKRYYGDSIASHIASHRMEKAAELLQEGEGMTIAHVASAVGYASQSRFCDAFKSHYGITPAEFRNKNPL